MKAIAISTGKIAGLTALTFLVSHPAFAQLAGGTNPVTSATSAFTLLLTVAAVIAAIAWVVAGLACFAGRVHYAYFWAAGAGTIVIAGAAYISSQLLGGGGAII